MHRIHRLSALTILIIPLLVSCGPDEPSGASVSEDPRAHCSDLVELLEKGELENAYALFFPPKYEKDLEGIFARLKTLITKKDFEKARDLLHAFGTRIKPVLARTAVDQATKDAIATLGDLPTALGLESYTDFKKLDVRTLISRLETGLLKAFTSRGQLVKMAGSPSFETVKIGQHYADLEVTITPPAGKIEKTMFRVVKVDGHWVPKGLADDWKKGISEILEQVAALTAAKQENPQVILAALEIAEQSLDTAVQQVIQGFGSLFTAPGHTEAGEATTETGAAEPATGG